MPNKQITDGNYRYAFQGQEKDPETGMEAFELRLWDGRLGRWLTVDPMGQYNSPYLGMGNNPVSHIDPDGGTDGDTGGPGKGFWSNLWSGVKSVVSSVKSTLGLEDKYSTIPLDEVSIVRTRNRETIACNPLSKGGGFGSYDFDFDFYGDAWWGNNRGGDLKGPKGHITGYQDINDWIVPSGVGGKFTFWADQMNIGRHYFLMVKNAHGAIEQGGNVIKAIEEYDSEIIKSTIIVKQYEIHLDTKTFDSTNVERNFSGERKEVHRKNDSTRENSKEQRRNSIIYLKTINY